MAHEDQFTATGPAFEGAGFPRAAFSTGREGADSTYGVNVQGSECGVYGESGISGGIDTGRTPPSPANANGQTVINTGVCGRGLSIGVFGDGFQHAGVYGQTDQPRASGGVVGVGRGAGVRGVTGASIDPRRPDKRTPDTGAGVIGVSNNMGGFGVVGVSIIDFPRDDPHHEDFPHPRLDTWWCI